MKFRSARMRVAVVFFAASAALPALLPAASAPDPTAPPAYQGWVHMADAGAQTPGTDHWNTRTGAIASSSGNTLIANLRDPVKMEISDYHASTGIIRTNDLAPAQPGASITEFPTAYDDLLAKLQEALGKENVRVTQHREQGLDRHDFTLVFPPVKRFADITSRDQWLPLHRVFSAWVDPQTGLLAKVAGGDNSVSLTYGAPEINSIYDLGAPRNAHVVSIRPTAAALVVYDRMQASLRKPTPDGILVVVLTGKTYGQITLYYQHGVDWAMRDYRILAPGPNGAGGAEPPTDWQTTGADEFFRRLALAMPESERSGDDTVGWQKSFDPKTGEVFLSWGAEWVDENGKSQNRDGKDPGPAKLTQGEIFAMHTLNGPTSWAFPREALSGRYGLDNHFEIATSDDHPGLLALRTRYEQDPPTDLPRFISEAWIDPAHNDRSVLTTATAYQDPPSHEIDYKVVKEYSDFQSYPAPDGRSYPRICQETTYRTDKGKLVAGDQRETRVQFFPNRALPEIPKAPSGGFPQQQPDSGLP